MASESFSRARQFRDALYESLAGAEAAVRDASPLIILSRLTERGAALAIGDASARMLIESLAAVARAPDVEAAVAVAETRFETPDVLREALYFGRCLARSAPQGLRLLQARRYLEEAVVPVSLPDLHTDREAALRHVTFAALWREPARFDSMIDAVAIWRRDYAGVYANQHAVHQAAVSAIAEAMDALVPQVRALERLNGLTRLGPPLATAALAQFRELERAFACPAATVSLAEALARGSTCPECGFHLGNGAPVAEARHVRQAVERGLAGQQARLARRVVSRILGRAALSGEERLRRFIEVVQASDLSGLAVVLDDALVDFLRELLEEPAIEPQVLRRLALAFPEVTPESLDKAVAEFRHLLETELRLQGRVRLGGEEP